MFDQRRSPGLVKAKERRTLKLCLQPSVARNIIHDGRVGGLLSRRWPILEAHSRIVPRHARVSGPFFLRNSFNRLRSAPHRLETTPSASPVFSTKPSGSYISWRLMRVQFGPTG